jgi:hypothetical protein
VKVAKKSEPDHIVKSIDMLLATAIIEQATY